MNEHADAAVAQCETTWNTEVEAKVIDWAQLVDVICRLVPHRGNHLRTTVADLRRVRIPETTGDAKRVSDLLVDLSDIIGSLGLKTAFGKFLQQAASAQGANLLDASKPEVLAAIAEHNIEHVFRVRLS